MKPSKPASSAATSGVFYVPEYFPSPDLELELEGEQSVHLQDHDEFLEHLLAAMTEPVDDQPTSRYLGCFRTENQDAERK